MSRSVRPPTPHPPGARPPDLPKGALPAAVGMNIGGELLGVVAGLAAFFGHLFPVYLGLRGGKGVATGFGVVAVLLPFPTLAALAVSGSAFAQPDSTSERALSTHAWIAPHAVTISTAAATVI